MPILSSSVVRHEGVPIWCSPVVTLRNKSSSHVYLHCSKDHRQLVLDGFRPLSLRMEEVVELLLDDSVGNIAKAQRDLLSFPTISRLIAHQGKVVGFLNLGNDVGTNHVGQDGQDFALDVLVCVSRILWTMKQALCNHGIVYRDHVQHIKEVSPVLRAAIVAGSRKLFVLKTPSRWPCRAMFCTAHKDRLGNRL